MVWIALAESPLHSCSFVEFVDPFSLPYSFKFVRFVGKKSASLIIRLGGISVHGPLD